jgi:hypothetical protein
MHRVTKVTPAHNVPVRVPMNHALRAQNELYSSSCAVAGEAVRVPPSARDRLTTDSEQWHCGFNGFHSWVGLLSMGLLTSFVTIGMGDCRCWRNLGTVAVRRRVSNSARVTAAIQDRAFRLGLRWGSCPAPVTTRQTQSTRCGVVVRLPDLLGEVEFEELVEFSPSVQRKALQWQLLVFTLLLVNPSDYSEAYALIRSWNDDALRESQIAALRESDRQPNVLLAMILIGALLSKTTKVSDGFVEMLTQVTDVNIGEGILHITDQIPIAVDADTDPENFGVDELLDTIPETFAFWDIASHERDAE